MKDEGVPFALDERGQLADIAIASPARRYTCLNCRETVIPKALQSTVVSPYFSHLPGSVNQSEGCSKESITHLAAKTRLVEALRNGEDVRVSTRCVGWAQKGSSPRCSHRRDTPLPTTFDEVRSEYRYDAFRFDVALLENHTPVFAFEVRYAHVVTDAKANAISVPFVEFDADDVFRTPLVLHSVQDNLEPWRCPECEAKKERERRRQEARSQGRTTQPEPFFKQPPSPMLEERGRRVVIAPRFDLSISAEERLPLAKAWLTKYCGDVETLPALSFTLGSCASCQQVMVLFFLILNGRALEEYCRGHMFPATLKSGSATYAAHKYVNACPECSATQPPIPLPTPAGQGSFVFASSIKALW